MIPVAEAINIVRRESEPLPVEPVDIGESLWRVLARDAVADSDLPPFNRAQMDGYALRAADTENATQEAPARLRVVGEAAAGRGWRGRLQSGEAVRIMTGAPVPDGADSVQRVEVTSEREGGAIVEIGRSTTPGQ
ncbi:MAG TPA: hypothetical protein VM943_12090, partial [Pyrinomonadaceae bacterium]|nr:hypothetical protein [Pyrinomonadaceae bacterium]